jgi:nucleoside-triphosphatase THEP1
MVGQYTAMLEEFEPVALRALSSKSNTLIIDEIGKMEKFQEQHFPPFNEIYMFYQSLFLSPILFFYAP